MSTIQLLEIEMQSASAWPDSLWHEGEMGRRTLAYDWDQTPLGPMEHWSQSLRAAVGMALANSFPMAIIWGKDYIQLYNDAFMPIAGHNHPAMLGNHCWNTWAEIWHDILEPTLISIRQNGKAIMTESQHFPVLRFGYMEEVYCMIAYSPLRDDTGEIEGFLITISETTGQVLGERRLRMLRDLGSRASEARSPKEACELATCIFETGSADIPFALIYLLDDTGENAILACTAGIKQGLPASPDTVNLLQEPENWPFQAVMSEGAQQIHDLEARFDSLPGGPWPESPRTAVVLPLKSQIQERPIGFLIAGVSPRREYDAKYGEFLDLVAAQISTSIANAKAYEMERQRAEELAKLDHAKTTFFSNVSHEFRTPLTLILGPFEDILKADDLSDARREQLSVIHRNALRLLKLVNSLLDFSRIEAGRTQASFRPTELSMLTADVASNFRSIAEKEGLKFIVDCPLMPEMVYVDREMWEKIILNLVSNAFKHTFEGSIEIKTRFENNQAVLLVTDTGVGIAKDQIPYLFERFHRVPNVRSRTHEGTGIGLALVKELVKLQGGDIEVRSVLGQGTEFRVCIPSGSEHLPQEHIEVTSTLSSTAISPLSFVEESWRWVPEANDVVEPRLVSAQPGKAFTRAQIVLADDNADMRAYVKRLLEPYHDVIAVSDGEAALKKIEEQLPDLVLTDIMMPRLDGLGLLRQLRSNARTKIVPVILLSARAGEEAGIDGFQAGADDYLVKPFSANELIARINTNLEMSRLRQDAEMKVRQSEKMNVVGQLAGGIAHDFNSLLTVLIGRLDMLEEYVSDKEGRRILESASKVTERSIRLVKQILAFSRKQPLQVKETNLNALIENMAELLNSSLGKKIQVEYELETDLWPALIDTTQMEMILLNLGLNARDAMPVGGTLKIATRNIELEEELDELSAGKYVELLVSDNGTGMAPDILNQVFEPFFTTKGVGEGVGLGLSQVYGTIKQLGGTVKIESAPAEGTTVVGIFPVAQ